MNFNEFDRMLEKSKNYLSGFKMIFIHNVDYKDHLYKDIPCLKTRNVEKGLIYLIEKKYYDNLFI